MICEPEDLSMADSSEKGNRITDKQQEILEFVRKSIMNSGYPPTVREIGEAVHLRSTSSVQSHLDALEKNGYIRRNPMRSRSIEIMDDDYGLYHGEVVRVPLVGHVAAGEPLLAEQNIDGYYPFPSNQLPKNSLFLLRVRGESMINMGIYDGDLILVEQGETARNGDVVVALVEDSATVKRFYKENGHIRLQPENDEMEPIIVPDCRIIGHVIGLLRLGIH